MKCRGLDPGAGVCSSRTMASFSLHTRSHQHSRHSASHTVGTLPHTGLPISQGIPHLISWSQSRLGSDQKLEEAVREAGTLTFTRTVSCQHWLGLIIDRSMPAAYSCRYIASWML